MCQQALLARESEHVLFTNAGPEIGVASTKAFTTQLAGLMLLAMSIAKSLDQDKDLRKNLANELRALPAGDQRNSKAFR